MGYQAITSTSLADFISKLQTAMITAGWLDTGLTGSLGSASGKILRSAADSVGRYSYVELFEDAVGNIAIHESPELNDAGTDIHPNLDFFKSVSYLNATWDAFIYADSVWATTGTDIANYRFGFGLYATWASCTLDIWPYACFLVATHAYDTGVADRPYVMQRGDTGGRIVTTFNWLSPWGNNGLFFFANSGSSGSPSQYRPTGFPDGTLGCIRAELGGLGSYYDISGRVGYFYHMIMVGKATVELAVNDRVTIDGGVSYYIIKDLTEPFFHYNSLHLLLEE